MKTRILTFLVLVFLAALALAGQRISVGGKVQESNLISRTQPPYPDLARQARIQGVVRLEAMIGTDGRVKDLKVISGHPLLVQSALDNVRDWVYRPVILNGAAVEVVTTIDVNFTLDGKPTPEMLASQGRQLQSDDVAKLERDLAAVPANSSARAQLLGYYASQRMTQQRLQILAWLVENDPASPVLNVADAHVPARGSSLADPAGHAMLKDLWLKKVQSSAQNPEVILAAARFLETNDKPQAETLLLQAALSSPLRDAALGRLYAQAIMGYEGRDDGGRPIFNADEAGGAFAQQALAALSSTSSTAMAQSALMELRAVRRTQGDKWDALVSRLEGLGRVL